MNPLNLAQLRSVRSRRTRPLTGTSAVPLAAALAVPLAGALAALAVLAPTGRLAGGGTGEVVIGGARVVTATTVASAANPSLAGGLVTYIATVRPAPGSGTVAFADHAAPIPGCRGQPVDPATGAAACRLTYPGPGSHAITAAYSGDASHAASTSAPLTQQVAYRAQPLHTRVTPGQGGPTVPVQLELLDAQGTNVSAPGIRVTVTGLFPRPPAGVPPPRAFTCLILGWWLGYQLNVNTVGYPAGTYTLSFTAGADPTTHTAQFTVP